MTLNHLLQDMISKRKQDQQSGQLLFVGDKVRCRQRGLMFKVVEVVPETKDNLRSYKFEEDSPWPEKERDWISEQMFYREYTRARSRAA